MAGVSESSKVVARHVADAFGKRPKIVEFWDADNRYSVAIAAATDVPQESITSYSTVNLSDWPMYVDGKEHQTRVEFAGAAPVEEPQFQNAVSTAAFYVIKQKWASYPGAIFPDILSMYHLSVTMKHVMFAEPFLWEKLEESVQLPDRLVTWLLMVPISDSEYEFAKANGSEALDELFGKQQPDIFDLQRRPLV